MNKTFIDYDAASNSLAIAAPFMMLGKTRGIPARKWHPSSKTWRAPLIRRNVEYITKEFADADVSPEAQEAMTNALRTSNAGLVPVTKDLFPKGYVFKTLPLHKNGQNCRVTCKHKYRDTYQYRALDRIWPLVQAGVHAGMGTGKSWIAIQNASARYQSGRVQATIFFTRSSGKSSIAEHWYEHCPILFSLHELDSGNEKAMYQWLERVKSGQYKGMPVLLVGIESLQASQRAWDACQYFVRQFQCYGVLDESSRIKTPAAIRSKRITELGTHCVERLTMTGTPITQGIEDLYMQFQYLNPNILGIGDYDSFRRRYMIFQEMRRRDGSTVKTARGNAIKTLVGYDNLDELMDTIRPFIVQIPKNEAMPDLPPKVYKTVVAPMTPEQRRLHKELRSGLGADILHGERLEPKGALDLLLKLRQISGGFYTVERDPILRPGMRPKRIVEEVMLEGDNPKLTALLETLESVEGSVIIWAWSRAEVAMITNALQLAYGADQVVEFHGGISEPDRLIARQRFQSFQSRFFVGTPQSGGMVITLTAADTEIFFSNSFSWEDRDQAESRAWGRGSVRKSILTIDMVLKGSVDRLILQALRDKKDVADFVSMKQGQEEVRELLKLVA